MSLEINTNEVTLPIVRNGQPVGEITFDPYNTMFVEKFYVLFRTFKKDLTEYQQKIKNLDAEKEVDENGMPLSAIRQIEIINEACQYLREKIDQLFGSGTSQKVFGDAMNLMAIKQFFEGVAPFIQKARTEKISQYTSAASAKRNKRK